MGRVRKITIVGALLLTMVMVFSALAATEAGGSMLQFNLTRDAAPAAAPTAFTYPTTTLQEPNYTGGTYIMASTTDVSFLNVWKYSDLYSGMLLDEIYDSADAFGPNQTYFPWAASSYVETAANPSVDQVFDPLTGAMESYAYTWNVTLRPNIQWSDWTPTNSPDTYTYSNQTIASLDGVSYSYTYPWPSVTMRTYEMQSADLILSWELLVSSMDYSSSWANIVDVAPLTNLTAEFFLSAQSATFVTATLGTPIIPYHVWQPHDCAAVTPTAWNYTGTCDTNGAKADAGYDVWDVGYNAATGTSNDLIGSGPFAFTNSFSSYQTDPTIPQGSWVVGDYWELYVNPHYFAQYWPSLQVFSPKIFEIYTPLYLSESDAVTAFLLGQVDTVLNGVDPTYIPTIDTDPNAFIFYQPAGAFGFIQLNSWGAGQPAIPGTSDFLPEVSNAPFNITAIREAMNYATDKAYLASVVDEGYDTLGQPVIPSADAIWHNDTANQYSYDPTLAESMIAGVAGMTKNSAGDWLYDGSPVTLNIQTTVASEDPLGVEGDEIVAQEWTAIGIPTTVTQEAFASLLPPLFGYGYSAISLGITGIAGDPTSYLIEVYNASIGIGSGFYNGPFSSLTWNGTAYTGTQIDELMGNLTTELNSISNLAQRISLADEIEGIADAESVIINTGYPVSILPFDNATFTGLEENPLPFSSYMYFNFLSFALKTPTKVIPPSAVPTQLKVGVVPDVTNVFTNGQYGNITVQVRNQYGQPEAGMNVAMGFTPEGMLLNVSSDSGVTSAAGTYTWEFKVLSTNGNIWTADNLGEINVTAAATPPAAMAKTVLAGLGWTYIDVEPDPVAFYATNNTDLPAGGGTQAVNILVYNPLTGAPISGYVYTVEALNGAVNLTTNSPGQTSSEVSDYLADFGFGYASVLVGGVPDYNLTAISGTTGTNGVISVLVQQNGSSDLSANGNPFQTWLFIGAYQDTATVPGLPPYASIAEVSSAFDAPSSVGPGVLEPAEIPLTVSDPPAVDISMTVSATTVTATGSVQVTVTVTNATTHDPIYNANVTVYAQNDFGANRGYLTALVGTDEEVFNPNGYFASTFLPGIQVQTGSNGEATLTFNPGVYNLAYPGGVPTYEAQAYADAYLIPADEWELAAYVTNATTDLENSTTADLQISSTQVSTPATPTPFASAYLAGSAVSLNGVVSVAGSSSYTLFVNTTENGPAGPLAGGVSILAISTSLGTVTPGSGTTSSAGSLQGTLTVPSVSTPSLLVITIEYSTGSGTTANSTLSVYVVPSKVVTTTTSTNLDLYYALIGIFAVLTVIFAALWVGARGRRMPPEGGTGNEPMMEPSSTSSSSKTGPGAGGSGPPGGS